MTWITFSIKKTMSFLTGFGMLLVLANVSFAESGQVPFGDKVSGLVLNYNRTTPFIATSGRITGNGISEIKSHGFKTILDLRTAREGTAEEQKAANAAGLGYHNIQISGAAPTKDQVKAFTSLVDDKDNYPLLVHCASANRVGALWALYRVSKGVAFNEAVLEARTIGLKPRRESQIRAMLRQPAK